MILRNKIRGVEDYLTREFTNHYRVSTMIKTLSEKNITH